MLKLLILFPKLYWETKASIVRRSAIRAMLRSELVETHLSGQGWDDWDATRSVQENADRLMPGADAIFSYKSLGHPKRGVPPLIDPHKFNGLRIESFNECHDPTIVQDAVRAGTNLAVLHLANSAADWRDTNIRTVNIPHCAEVSVFAAAARPWHERDIPVLLTGTLSPQVYPLRCRLAALIRSGKIPGVIHPHPGNYLKDLDACDRQEREYAELLGRANIVLGCTSIYRYRLARIPEIAMSGACVMSDFPDENVAEHSGFIREIHSAMSDDELVAEVQHAVENDYETRQYAECGHRHMTEYYRMDDYVGQFLCAINSVNSVER